MCVCFHPRRPRWSTYDRNDRSHKTSHTYYSVQYQIKTRYKILYKVCPSFCSHCSDKWPQQKQASGRRVYFSSQFKIKVHHKRKFWLYKFESWPQQIHQERAVHRPVNLHFNSLCLPLQILLAYIKPRIKIKHDKVSEISLSSTRICKMAQAIFTFIQKKLLLDITFWLLIEFSPFMPNYEQY